ncbi:gliding motility-associated ABC transporter substrate-binding protein GldG [Abyssalbus ytuae]|uniref:Gliding motility-associated ABC transporter substrate-binding protein GldG n=1 Tax=Abyssalbus ytuae TaxID=2926907 RepID=A0A9E6ZP00_9FLAO|nr:gliding motility-associated ABC transporter substrate-binding protein GldG [Abyssalbus ytuae]UOB17865.1 gliding motility-associated ABC transporter substrate-binding protein GldG [Abyssalbus ytuae]
MVSILKREINSFFSSATGYLVIAVFLILNGLFLWVFKGDFNILNSGFADLSPFFQLVPWIFIFLIPAVTMKTFSEEKRQGTLELLLTKPISHLKIVLGKYFGTVALVLIALVPTLLYVFTISKLGNPPGNFDWGSTTGSYFGLLFLILAYSAIGVFCSILTENQIVAFIGAVFVCFLFYYGFEGIADIFSFNDTNYFISHMSMKAHFDSISRGVIDTRDIIYFLSISGLFITLTTYFVKEKKILFKTLAITLAAIILLTVLSTYIFKRFDLTQDKRYTLSEATKNLVKQIDKPVIIDVLLQGNFPPEFKKLQIETKQILQEFAAINSNIKFSFVNPLEDEKTREEEVNTLQQLGLAPVNVTVDEGGKISQELVFPWAITSLHNKSVKVSLLKNKLGATTEERVNNSVQQLEYVFVDAFTKLTLINKKKIAILKGNGELSDLEIADFLTTLHDYYNIAPFTLDSVASDANQTLKELNKFDLAIIAKPTSAFTDEEKLVLDQFTMNGGKSVWLIDQVAVEMDSLFNEAGRTFAIPRNLNIKDMFFKYGVRINPVLINDLYFTQIVLATGEGNNSQYNPVPWLYSPMVFSKNNHPVNNNMEALKFEFANSIDTLANNIRKTILLTSSPLSKIIGTPKEIKLDIINEAPEKETFNNGLQPLTVLLEGNFTSVYKNRVKPFKPTNYQDEGVKSKMIIIADGDLIKNQLNNGQPLELGYDKWTNNFYGNKEFLLNCVNYLLDDNGLINIRTKEISISFLDKEKVAENKNLWISLNIGLPIVLLILFGVIFNYLRRKKYTS